MRNLQKIFDTIEYIGYSPDSVYKLKSNEWEEGVHFFKKSGKVLFDKGALDKWIMGDPDYSGKDKKRVQHIVDSVLNSIDR